MHDKNKIWVVVGVIVAVLVVAGIVSLVKKGSNKLETAENKLRPPVYLVKTDAPNGTLAPSLPPQLIVDQQANIVNSYQTSYETGGVLSSAQYTSDDSISDLYNHFLTLLKNGSYKIIVQKQSSTLAEINAVNSSSNVSVQITKVDKKSNVVVTYVVR